MTEIEGQVLEQELDAERQARRRLALAQIRQYPDPALRMQAKPVKIFDDELRRLVERMRSLMEDASGVGLAATQLGILQRVFVFDLGEEDGEVVAVANPVITERGEETAVDDEGCLSLQGVLVPVERSLRIHVEGKNELGEDVSHDLENAPARTAQHELDHLDGLLIIDRTTPEARKEALSILRPRVVLG